MSGVPLLSPATRLEALDSKATWLPSALSVGSKLRPFAWPPPVATLTRSVVCDQAVVDEDVREAVGVADHQVRCA